MDTVKNERWFHRRITSLNPSACVLTVLRHRTISIGIISALTLLFAAFIPNIAFKTSIHDLIIDDLPENVRYQAFKEIFGSEEIIRVVVSGDDIFDPVTFRMVARLEEAAAQIEGVQRVIGLPGIKQTIDLSGTWPMEKFVDFVSGADLFKHNLISDDRRTTLITLVLKQDADQGQVIDRVQGLIADRLPGIHRYQIGMPLISQALAQFTQRDFMRMPPFTFLVIAVVLFIIFRSVGYVMIPLSCVALSLVWAFGICAILEVPLSILTMIVPVFLIAVGTAYCLHILAEFRSLAVSPSTAKEAVAATFAKTSLPTLLAILTTVLGLASLFVNRISAIREFALFSCIGMLTFLILILTYLPVALSFLPPRCQPAETPKRSPSLLDRCIGRIIALNLHHQRITLMIIAGIAIVAGIGLLRLKSETNPVGYFKDDTAVVRNFHDIYQHLSGSFPVNVVMNAGAEDYFENAEHMADLAQLQVFLETLPGVDKTISFADYLKLVNYASNRFDPAFYRLPAESWELRMLMNSFKSLLGMDMFHAFMGPSLSQTNILLMTHISSSRDFLDLRKTVMAHVREAFSKTIAWDVTGFGIVISASSHYLVAGQIESFCLTMAVIFVIMFALFLSVKVGLIAIVPNLFPIVVNFGIMGWFDIELSMATSLIASVAIGLAVDDTIHYLVRFNREFRTDLDEKRALEVTLAHIGRPIIFTTVTIAAGFSILALSSFRPTAIFGTMMVITMLSAMVGDLLLLPILIQRIELVTLWDLVRIKMGGQTGLGIPLFQGLSRAEVQSIIMAGTLKKVKAGEMLFYKGDKSESMFTVISGRFDVIDYDPASQRNDRRGIQTCISTIGTGDILGEMGLLRSAPRSATVVATQDSELLPINWKVIQRLQWLYPPTAHKFFVNMMRILCDRVERLTTCLARENLVDDLTGLNNRRGFARCLKQAASRAQRLRQPLRVAVIQIEFAEPRNAGDEPIRERILKGVGETVAAVVRRCDMISRIDVDRFAMVLEAASDIDIQRVEQRLQSTLQALTYPGDDDVRFTMAFWVEALDFTDGSDCEREIDRVLKKIEARNGNPVCT